MHKNNPNNLVKVHNNSSSNMHNNSSIYLCNMTNHTNNTTTHHNTIVQIAQRTIGLQRAGGARMWERERRGTIGGGVGEGAYSTREYKGTGCRGIQMWSVFSDTIQHNTDRVLEYTRASSVYIYILY